VGMAGISVALSLLRIGQVLVLGASLVNKWSGFAFKGVRLCKVCIIIPFLLAGLETFSHSGILISQFCSRVLQIKFSLLFLS